MTRNPVGFTTRILLSALTGIGLSVLVWAGPAGAESPCDSETVLPDQESPLRQVCEVLWDFYTTLDDPGVLDDTDNIQAWGADTPLGTWQGTGWGDDGKLTTLILTSSGLRGPVSSRLGDLTDLIVLGLDGNELNGPIPPELGHLLNLSVLALDSNEFTRSLPVELGQLARLEVLRVHYNQLTGSIPVELGALSNLVLLSMHTNQLTGPIPQQLGLLSNLTYLELGSNNFTGSLPINLGNLSKLTYLVIHSSNLSGPIPPQIGQLTQLRQLHMYNNGLTGSIPLELGQLLELEVLDLSNNKLEGPIPAELGELSNLTSLRLQNNRLSGSIPDELNQLPNLESINLHGNDLTGQVPSQQRDGSTSGPDEGPFAGDPLGLIAHTERYRDRTLGRQTWELWFCDVPLGDATVRPQEVARRLNSEITPYFRWLSDGKYIPEFRITGDVKAEDRDGCVDAAWKESPDALLAVVTDAADGQAYGGGRLMLLSADSVVKVLRRPRPSMFVVAHELGHTLGWPHSYGGKTEFRPPTDSVWNPTDKWTARINEYDNPMELMSGPPTSLPNIATIAVNRYAAGWIDPEDVRIHMGGTATYELSVPGMIGIQMLVLPTGRTGRFYTIGARLGTGHDIAVPRQGIEVYRIDQTTPVPGRYTGGLRTRIQPYPPEPTNASASNRHMTDHVHRVGDTLEIARYSLEVLERTATGFIVTVEGGTPPSTEEVPNTPVEPVSEPDFAGRFSDDDGSVHETNIEVIEKLGITLGCNPPDNDRYCPTRSVTRAQMMAFLARALGEDVEAGPGTSRFSDVADDAWYRPSLERMADIGVVEPYEDGTFRPDEPLTRLDMAVFLVRAFESINVVEPQGMFTDVAVDADHAGEVEGVLAAGVTKGCSVDPLLYCPDQPVRRDQMASFLVRALNANKPG